MAWTRYIQYGGVQVTATLFNKNPPLVWSTPVAVPSYNLGFDPIPSTIFGKRLKPVDYIWQPTNYLRSRYNLRHNQTIVKYSGTNIVTTYGWTSGYFGPDNVTSAPPASISYDPMNELIGKLRTEVTNFATMLGEYKETASMFEDVAGKILKSYRLARKGNITDAVKALGRIVPSKKSKRPSLSSSWLQWHFGIETLLSDLAGSVKELQGRIEKPMVMKRACMRKDVLVDYLQLVGTAANGRFRRRKTQRTKILSCIVEVDPSLLRDLSDHGLTNPPALFWELTSMSWAFDYLIGVGDYLTALDMPCYLSRSVCWETNILKSHGILSGTGKWGLSNSYTVIQGLPASFVYRETSRTIRVLGAVMPQWNPSLSTPRIASLLSVLRQRTSK